MSDQYIYIVPLFSHPVRPFPMSCTTELDQLLDHGTNPELGSHICNRSAKLGSVLLRPLLIAISQ